MNKTAQTHIRTVKKVLPKSPNGKNILYMHGYGGFTWQAAKQLKILKEAGYTIHALDFKKVLHSHEPSHLIELIDEVDDYLQRKKLVRQDLLIVGISIGGLVGYNMTRRHPELHRLLIITGGNVSLLPSDKSLKKSWGLTRDELARIWRPINMYTPAGALTDKNVIMLLPLKDKIIDPDEVVEEIRLQRQYNNVTMIRTKGGHYRTIITETILKPKNVLKYLRQLESY